jgi:hypothetical protein
MSKTITIPHDATFALHDHHAIRMIHDGKRFAPCVTNLEFSWMVNGSPHHVALNDRSISRPAAIAWLTACLAPLGYTVIDAPPPAPSLPVVAWPTHGVAYSDTNACAWIGTLAQCQTTAAEVPHSRKVVSLSPPPPHPSVVELARAILAQCIEEDRDVAKAARAVIAAAEAAK